MHSGATEGSRGPDPTGSRKAQRAEIREETGGVRQERRPRGNEENQGGSEGRGSRRKDDLRD